MAARWLETDSPSAISKCASHPACLSAARAVPKHESRWRPPPEVHDQVHSSVCETNGHSPLLPLRCAPLCLPKTGKTLPLLPDDANSAHHTRPFPALRTQSAGNWDENHSL